LFEKSSRYANVEPYLVTDRRGRSVQVVPPAPAPLTGLLGYHLRKQGQRLDHLAARYLGDATRSYRIAELADVMHPDAVAEASEIPIPRKG
jgi:hypothetical protein